MSNIVNLPPNNKSGLYKAPRHSEGGVQVIVDGTKKIEVEGEEYHLEKKVLYNNKEYEFKDKTNLEILDYIFKDNKSVFVQGQANSSDYIICRLAVLDKTRKDFYGTAKDFVNMVQGEHGCKTTGDNDYTYQHRLGGEISPTDTDIDSIKEKIKKVEDVNLYLQKYISENEKNILDLKVKDYKKQLSVNKKTIKSYKDRIKELSKNENESVTELDNLLIKGEHKKAKVEKEANSRVYVRFEDGTSEIISKEKYDKYKNDFNEEQLKKGSKVELEHIDTLKKVSKGELSAKEGAIQISKDHIAEDPAYYDKLETVESPFYKFIEIVDTSKDFDEAYSKAKQIKDVPSEVATAFYEQYNPEGKLSMEKSFRKFYDEHKKDDLEFKVVEQELPFKGNPNAKWVKVSHVDKNGNTLMQGIAIDLYGSKEKAIDAAKEKIKAQIKKDSEKQELQDLIDLLKDAIKENPNDQESKDLLELHEENLKELNAKFESGGSINRKLTYLGEVGGDKIGQKSSLEKAKSLEKQGISNEQIRQETGWFLNPHDKKWRFEISDNDFGFIYNFEDAKRYFHENKDKTFFKKKLSDIIIHDKLFLAYPEFKNVTFYFFNEKNTKLAGVFIPEDKEKEIFIIYNLYDEKSRIEHARGIKSTKTSNETWLSELLRISDIISGGSGLNYRPISNDVYKFRRNILAHELQHLIQIREEFGAGSSSEWWFEEIIRKRGIDESKLSEIERNNLRIESKLYSKNSSGEIEARDIDLRLDFNDKERKGIIPLSLVIVNPDYVTIDIEENRFKQGGELNAEESILNAPCINKKFKFVESSDFNEYRKGGIISGLKGLFNSKDDDIDYEGIRDSVSDTIKKIAEKHNGTVNYILDKKDGSTSLDFNFPTPEDKYNFTQELNKFNNETLRLEKGGSINNMTKEELKAFYNTKEGKELDKQTYNKWKKIVNMSKSELEKFYNSEEGKEAGLSASEAKEKGIYSGRESARWIMKMKDVPYTEWTPEMWRWAKKQISFISRMSGMKGDLYDENGNKTKKHTSLLIWGHNPEKYEDGGEIKNINSLKELLSLEKEEAIKIIEGVLRSDSFYSESKKGSFYEMAKSSYVVCNDLLKFNKKNPIKTKMGDLAYFEPDYRLIARDGYFVAQIKYAAHQVTHLMNGKRVFDSSKNEDYSILMECLLNPDDRAVDSMDENKVYYHKVISTKQSGILVFEAVIDKLGVIKHITIMPNKTASHWNNYVTGNNQKGEIRYSLASPLVSPLSKSASEDEINTEETPLKTTDFVNVGNGSTNIQIKNDNMQEKNEKFSQGGEIEDVIVLLEPYEKDDEDFKRSMEFFKIMNQARINLELIKGDKSNSYTNDEFQTEVDRLILEKDNNYMKGTLFAGGGKIEVNKVSVYQTAFYGLSFADLGGYFESKFTDVIDLEDENVILKDAPIFLFFKNPYDTRYSSKISIDDVIGAIMPKKMEKDARNIFDKRFISYVTYSDDSTNEHKIEAIKKLADINEDIILK